MAKNTIYKSIKKKYFKLAKAPTSTIVGVDRLEIVMRLTKAQRRARREMMAIKTTTINRQAWIARQGVAAGISYGHGSCNASRKMMFALENRARKR